MAGTLFTIVHIFICIFLVCLVLLQQGKGADVGATFGGGGNTMFGAGGADNFLTKVTTFVAMCFMLTSLVLTVQSQDGAENSGTIFQNLPETTPIVTTDVPPAAPAPDAQPAAEPLSNEAAAPQGEEAAQEEAGAQAAEEAPAEPAADTAPADAEPAEAPAAPAQ